MGAHFFFRSYNIPKHVFINQWSEHDHDLALKMSLSLAEKSSSIENAMILLPYLPAGKDIAQTADLLFNYFRVGSQTKGRGILYLYSKKENLFRIEVSYALEADFPDAFCRQMEEAAKTYMLSEVPQDFLSELIITLNRKKTEPMDGLKYQPPLELVQFLSGGAGATAHGYSFQDYDRLVHASVPEKYKHFIPTDDLDTTLKAYIQSLELGIGDPHLPLLTAGSQIFRVITPRNPAQLQRIHRYFTAAPLFRLISKQNMALAVPAPGNSSLPIVLIRSSKGTWYVDEVKSWTLFHRFEDNPDFFIKYADNPFLLELKNERYPNMDHAIYRDALKTPPTLKNPSDLAISLNTALQSVKQTPNDVMTHERLGSLYFYEMNWIRKAIEQYELAERAAPRKLSIHWILFDLYLNDSRPEKSLAELRTLTELDPANTETQRWLEFYQKSYEKVKVDFPQLTLPFSL